MVWGSLKMSCAMARWRLADILLINKAMLNQSFGDKSLPLHFRFQAAVKVLQRFQAAY